MTRLAELWNQLDDPEKVIAFRVMRHYLDERGAELVRAIAAHAGDHTTAPAPCPDPAPVVKTLTCDHCEHPIDGEPLTEHIEINGASRVLWLHEGCYRVRQLRRITPTQEAL